MSVDRKTRPIGLSFSETKEGKGGDLCRSNFRNKPVRENFSSSRKTNKEEGENIGWGGDQIGRVSRGRTLIKRGKRERRLAVKKHRCGSKAKRCNSSKGISKKKNTHVRSLSYLNGEGEL